MRPSLVSVGGPAGNAVISLQSLEAKYAFTSWTEVSGDDRYATAANLASAFGRMHQTVGLATGDTWPDALAAISTLPYESPDEILVFGGTKAEPDAAVTALEKMTGRSGWVCRTNRVVPEVP